MTHSTESTQEREAYYQRLASHDVAPLWTVFRQLLTPTPKPRAVPHHWRWATLRPLLDEALRLVPIEEAERRVLVLENPRLKGESAITSTLYAGLQIIGAGETARAHRHTANALRFVLEGEGAFTAVNGERAPMQRGDFIITPVWTWHDHGNQGSAPVVWLDGLDLPAAQALAAIFFEPFQEVQQPPAVPEDDSRWRWGQGLRPTFESAPGLYSPIRRYPYLIARESLARLAATTKGSPYDGIMLQYMNPLNGGPAMPTIDAFLQWLPPRASLTSHRHTGSTVYCAVEGRGILEVDGIEYQWEPNDVMVVPSWAPHRHRNPHSEPAILFSFTDAPLLRPFGLYREEEVSG
ncbi:MAG: cupin domain-containing protein [Firmicutes bacterium]|nr:cupin domain-containing protein [Bacillota bacterium]